VEENTEQKSGLPQILDPFRVVIIMILLALPVVTALNLTAGTRELKNVLGARSFGNLSVEPVAGSHDYINSEMLKKGEESFEYTAEINKREAGTYSKPILKLNTGSAAPVEVKIYGRIEGVSFSKLSLIFAEEGSGGKDTEYVIDYQESESSYLVELSEASEYMMYLKVRNENDILYPQNIKISLTPINE
jgi:hypothetical protein